MSFFQKENPETLLEGLDKALALLNERYQKKQITIEQFQKQAMEFTKKREKYQRKLEKQNK